MEALREQETGHSSGAGICRLSLPIKKSTFQDDQAESGTLGTICHDSDPQATTLPGCHVASSPAASLNSPTCLTPNARPFLL